jgi:hypothetical protein
LPVRRVDREGNVEGGVFAGAQGALDVDDQQGSGQGFSISASVRRKCRGLLMN